ncbi:MAG: FAD-dependent oxidoreductase [Fimbriimonadaceae bacterium]|nr:FAD-dependent oxidoreductase [Fimbriimonadaceae bacterium]
MRHVVLLALLTTPLPAVPVRHTFEAGWPRGWQTSGAGWDLRDGVLAVTTAQPGGFAWVPTLPLGRHTTVTVDLLTPAAGDRRGLSWGLSAGSPELTGRRAVQFAVRRGQLAWFDGAGWRNLLALPAGEALQVSCTLNVETGRLTVRATGAAAFQSAELPAWNLVGVPDTLFLTNADPDGDGPATTLLRTVEVEDLTVVPPAPVVRLVPVGARAVRIFWSKLPGVNAYRIYRDGELLASAPGDALVYLDSEVQPRTRYTYQIEAVGAGRSAPQSLVLGPANEAVPASGSYEVVVYGATPAGISAAVALGRAGRRALLIEPDRNLGGMITGGLGRTDFGSIHALGGLFKEFMDAVVAHYTRQYGADSAQVKACRGGLYFEPQVARLIFDAWIAAQPSVTLIRGTHLVGLRAQQGRVRSVVLTDRDRGVRRVVTAPLFIDASYEGDLAAAAGAPYRIGREAASEFGEQYAGELWWDVWQRKVVLTVGRGDRVVQAYNYRLCLTRNVDLRLAPERPRDYRRETYLGLLPDIRQGRLKALTDILSILPLPNEKWDANNHPQGNPSSDLVGGADRWPEASWEEREQIAEAHRQHILGLLWFCRFDPEVPESLRLEARQWGLARDEFPEQNGWPSCLYVREGRRLEGDLVFQERHAMAVPGGVRPPLQRDSIAVGAYPIDSHATGGRHPDHPDWLEGFFYLARGETQPYQIPFAVMLPQRTHNVIVACCVSATHVGYGTLRMEPVFMGLGLAAGVAADHALTEGRELRTLSVTRLQLDLLRQQQVLTVLTDVNHTTPGWAGFNLWGTFGAWQTYEAQPDQPLTGDTLAAWIRGPRAAAWQQTPVPAGDQPLAAAAADATLRQLASRLGQPAPAPLGDPVSRGAAMQRLHALLTAWLGSGAPRR